MKWNKLAWAAAVALALPQVAHALVIDFSQAMGGIPGNLGTSTYTSGPVTADAYYLKGNNYTNAADKGKKVTLFVRNEPFHDMVFGVCAPSEQSKSECAAPGKYKKGGGHVNELDNDGTKEMIRLTLADGWTWDNVWLSSIDNEKGQLWYSDKAGFNKDLSSFATLYKSYLGTPSEMSNVGLGSSSDATYLYFVPGPKGSDNDHLLWTVSVDRVAQVPEPATYGMFGLGLAMLGAIRLRRKAD